MIKRLATKPYLVVDVIRTVVRGVVGPGTQLQQPVAVSIVSI